MDLKKPPPHALVPGTDFTVDWHCRTLDRYQHSFLSHAHEDHLAGIRTFQSPRILHCTNLTAQVLLLKVPRIGPCLERHHPGTSFTIDGTTIHVLNANHTPGSAFFVFVLANGKRILHTGDFRADGQVVADASKFSPVDHLFIDCTFAISGLTIPPRNVCRDFVIEKCKVWLPRGYLVIIGTYTIGKEDVVLDVAEALACRVYATEVRLAGIRSLMQAGWRKSDLFVDDPESAAIHLVSIGMTSLEHAIEYAVSVKRTKVLAFQMTGWAGKPYWQSPTTLSARGVEAVAFGVPYSDHSSPGELLRFVQTVNPIAIVSTTQTSAKDIAKIQQMFLPFLRKDKSRRFLDFYAAPRTPKKEEIAPDDSQAFSPARSPDLGTTESGQCEMAGLCCGPYVG
jgi:DNA cross-link repair 1A protein